MSNPLKILRVIDAQTLTIFQNNQEVVVKLARIAAIPAPFVARLYVADMVCRPYRVELSQDGLEVFIMTAGGEFNLTDQMVEIGFALSALNN